MVKRELCGQGDRKICYVNVRMYKYFVILYVLFLLPFLGDWEFQVGPSGWGTRILRVRTRILPPQGGSLIELKRKWSRIHKSDGGWVGMEVGGSTTISVFLSVRVEVMSGLQPPSPRLSSSTGPWLVLTSRTFTQRCPHRASTEVAHNTDYCPLTSAAVHK